MKAFKALIPAITLAFTFQTINAINDPKAKQAEGNFQENKGQVYDQNYNSRPDVIYSGSNNGMVYHLKNNGVSYQLRKVDKWKEETISASEQAVKVPDIISIYRIDINWKNCNSNAVIEKGEKTEGVSNFYLTSCPNGISGVESYKSIIYKNIYTGIDLKWYQKNGNLEYDFVVKPGADPSNIQLEIKGAKKLSVNVKGELEIETPFGIITEKAPVAFQNKNKVKAEWLLVNSELSFKIDSYDVNEELIIDPVVRVWGTYYGGVGNDNMMDTKADATGNVYIAGYENASPGLATAGAHQVTVSGLNDCLLVKFNSIGVRQWATYYGGTGNDYAYGCAVAPSGDVYIGGSSASTTSISTVGSHQAGNGGNIDGVLVKFNSAGVRQWATYYGGTGDELIYGCTSDAFGNIFVSGRTNSSNNIATASGFQSIYLGGATDAFMAKFSPGGVRRWATYYGSSGTDEAYRSCTDPTGKVFFAGFTAGTGTIVATPGTHQTVNGGGGNPDGFLVKFDSVGVRQWATLYGGLGSDYGRACAIDGAGDVYLTGYVPFGTTSTLIATAGAFQTNGLGGSTEGYLVKFNSTGIRQWGTYISTIANDYILSCQFDGSSNIYVSGYTNVVTAANVQMSTAGSHQPIIAGLNDGFINKFNLSGVRQWGTYYGGALDDYIQSSCVASSGALYVTGWTSSPTGISTASAHQTTLSTATDGFLAQLKDCAGTTFSISGTNTVCAGQSLTLTGVGTAITTYSWSTGPSTSSIVVTPTATTVYSLSGTTSTLGCNYFTSASVTISPSPSITISSTNYSICSGNTVVITAAGATNYTWYPGNNSVASILESPLATSVYTVIGNSGACNSIKTVTINVTTTPTLILSSTSPVICSGNSILLNAYGASTYSWSSGPITQSISLSPTVTTNYTVTGYNGMCTDTETLQLTVNPSPTISTSNHTICVGGTATLIASGATTYNWSNGATTFSTAVTPTANTFYSVSGTNSFGCTASAAVTVFVGTSLGINVSASSNIVCAGDLVTITASGASTYTWSTNANTSSISVNPTTSTTYTINGQSGSCSGSNTILISVNALPTIAATANSTLICAGNTITLNANGASTYTWAPGSFTLPAITETPSITTVYTVTGTDVNGCVNSQTVSANVSPCSGIKTINGLNYEINIYPNPANDLVNIETSFEKFEVTIYNAIGQLVFEKKNDSGRLAINISSFAKGVYTIKLASAQEILTKKLIVE